MLLDTTKANIRYKIVSGKSKEIFKALLFWASEQVSTILQFFGLPPVKLSHIGSRQGVRFCIDRLAHSLSWFYSQKEGA